jgi:hypothetical protein
MSLAHRIGFASLFAALISFTGCCTRPMICPNAMVVASSTLILGSIIPQRHVIPAMVVGTTTGSLVVSVGLYSVDFLVCGAIGLLLLDATSPGVLSAVRASQVVIRATVVARDAMVKRLAFRRWRSRRPMVR